MKRKVKCIGMYLADRLSPSQVCYTFLAQKPINTFRLYSDEKFVVGRWYELTIEPVEMVEEGSEA